MSDFKLITEKNMGSLSPRHHKKFKRIEATREELIAALQQLDVDQDALYEKIVAKLSIDVTGPYRGLRIDDDGSAHAIYCPCASCQAQLNNMTATEATEAMLARGFIHGTLAPAVRAQAAAVDKARGKPYIH